MSEPTKRRFSPFPKSLRQEVEQLVKPVYKQQGFAEHRLLTEWDKIVGKALAKGSIPKKLTFPKGKREQGTLHIAVSSGARALELQHMQPMILERISTFFGYAAISRLVLSQEAETSREPKSRKAAPKVAINSDAAALVATCEDAALQQALLSLGAAVMRKE